MLVLWRRRNLVFLFSYSAMFLIMTVDVVCTHTMGTNWQLACNIFAALTPFALLAAATEKERPSLVLVGAAILLSVLSRIDLTVVEPAIAFVLTIVVGGAGVGASIFSWFQLVPKLAEREVLHLGCHKEHLIAPNNEATP